MKQKKLFHSADTRKAGKEPGDTHFELWGRDSFEGRAFLCGVYDNYEEARADLVRCSQGALSQDEELRDSYWLVGTDLAGIRERELKKRGQEKARLREKGYTPERLRVACERAIDRFVRFLRKNEKHPILN